MNLWVFYIFGRLCQRIVHWILQHIYFSLCVGFFLCCSGCSCSSFVHRVEHLIVCAIYCPPKCSLAGKLRHFIDLTANIANGETQNESQRKGTRNRRKCRNGRDGGRERRRQRESNRKDFRITNFWRMWNCVSVQKWLSIYGDYMGIAIHFDTCNATRSCLLLACECECTYGACLNALNVCDYVRVRVCMYIGGWPSQLAG